MEKNNVKLPPKETDFLNPTTADLMAKIQDFWLRYNKEKSDQYEGAVEDFLELIIYYPNTMCKREMNETLKLLVALFYFYKPFGLSPTIQDKVRKEIMEVIENKWSAPSYDYLAMIFCKSKASIHEAIKQKEAEARQLLEEAQLRMKAKAIALEELVREEKIKLTNENSKRMYELTEQTA